MDLVESNTNSAAIRHWKVEKASSIKIIQELSQLPKQELFKRLTLKSNDGTPIAIQMAFPQAYTLAQQLRNTLKNAKNELNEMHEELGQSLFQ